MTFKSTFIYTILALIFATIIIATPLDSLNQQLNPTFDPQQVSTFTLVQIDKIDGEDVWYRDAKTPDGDLPLFIYQKPCQMSYKTPTDTLPGDKAILAFVWCENDSADCQSSSSVIVNTTTIDVPNTNTTVTFTVPTLAWTKFMSSYVRFTLTHTRQIPLPDEPEQTETQILAVYRSKQAYQSDITTPVTKGVVVTIIVFCTVATLMALAVLIYFIVKKVKKMRRGRYEVTRSHNLWRR